MGYSGRAANILSHRPDGLQQRGDLYYGESPMPTHRPPERRANQCPNITRFRCGMIKHGIFFQASGRRYAQNNQPSSRMFPLASGVSLPGGLKKRIPPRRGFVASTNQWAFQQALAIRYRYLRKRKNDKSTKIPRPSRRRWNHQ